MLDRHLQTLIELTARELDLGHAFIEKDYYITQVLQSLSNIEHPYFQLVFCGGTCLAKAHRLIQRMSEDVDFKMHRHQASFALSRSQYRKELKNFRNEIIKVLTQSKLVLGDIQVRNEGQYWYTKISYPPLFETHPQLRPDILLEFTAAQIRLTTEKQTINTLIQDTLRSSNLPHMSLPISQLNCISAEETAVEKWVALTRRVGGIEKGHFADDSTLVRHIFDLSKMFKDNQMSDTFLEHTKHIVRQDAQQFKNQYPDYFKNPIKEIKQNLIVLKGSKKWKTRYDDLLVNMVFGKDKVQSYRRALSRVENMTHQITASLENVFLQEHDSQQMNPLLEKVHEQDYSEVLQDKEQNSLDQLLRDYVEMELEQSRLVQEMHSNRSVNNSSANSIASERAIAHSKNIKTFARTIIKHPDIQKELEKLKVFKSTTLVERGGFAAIHRRMQKGELSKADKQALVIQLRNKAVEQSHSQKQARDRGSRTR
jgi:hypothetical protein